MASITYINQSFVDQQVLRLLYEEADVFDWNVGDLVEVGDNLLRATVTPNEPQVSVESDVLGVTQSVGFDQYNPLEITHFDILGFLGQSGSVIFVTSIEYFSGDSSVVKVDDINRTFDVKGSSFPLSDILNNQDTIDGIGSVLFGLSGNDSLNGSDGRQILFGGAGNDILSAEKGSDFIFAGSGDDLILEAITVSDSEDRIDGGQGYDVVVFDQISSDQVAIHNVADDQFFLEAEVFKEGGSFGDLLKPADQEKLTVKEYFNNIERLVFSDNTFIVNTAENQDMALVRLYNAAFDRLPDQSGFVDNLSIIHSGQNGDLLSELADGFINSAEFSGRYGSSLSDTAFIDQLYKNVFEREADLEGSSYWKGQLSSGEINRADLLVAFSESEENRIQVDSLIGDGFWLY